MRLRLALSAIVVCFGLIAAAWGQDAAKVDPKHYTVMSENDQVRILKVHYGPHEKSVMHSHPNSVAVFMTDGKIHFTLPEGKGADMTVKAGEAMFNPAVTHLPEDTGDKPFELVLVELKGKGAKAASEKPAPKAEKK